MHVDVNRLRGKIKEVGMTQELVSKRMSMDKSTFSRKMKSEALDFSIGEMHEITQILKLTQEEAGQIFLS